MINTTKIPKIIKEWCSAIQKRNAKLMLSFYSYDAILLATYESICVGKKEIGNYFVKFLSNKNIQCTINKNFTQIDNTSGIVIASGIYTFSFNDKYGMKQVVKARYSYVIKNGYIINHHSSINP